MTALAIRAFQITAGLAVLLSCSAHAQEKSAPTYTGPTAEMYDDYVPPSKDDKTDSASGPSEKGSPPAIKKKKTEDDPAALAEARRKSMQKAKQLLESQNYSEATYPNLSKMYWSIGMFDPDVDIEAIDSYMQINECEIYNAYYSDDFEWQKIREATQQYLKQNKTKFPRRFQFLMPIGLGRYNTETQSFAVLSPELTTGTRRYETETNQTGEDNPCGKPFAAPQYPQNLVLVLSRPILIKSISVPTELAKDYLLRSKYKPSSDLANLPKAPTGEKYDRAAYAQLRVRIIKYLETRLGNNAQKYAVVFAAVEGYEIFEDREKTKLLYTSN